LPIAGSVLIAFDAFFRPSFKYAAYLMAQYEIESEQFRYKTRTGIYRPVTTCRWTNGRALFVQQCQNHFDRLMKSDASTTALLGFLQSKDSNDMPWSSNEQAPSRLPPDWKLFKKYSSRPLGLILAVLQRLGLLKEPITQRTNVRRVKARRAQVLYAEEYVNTRLKPHLKKIQKELRNKAQTRVVFRCMIISLTAAGAVFVPNGLEIWVPVLLAVAATFEFTNSYLLLDTMLPAFNATASELMDVLLWWDALSLIAKRQRSTRDTLVDRCEDAIVDKYEKLAKETRALAKKRYALLEESQQKEKAKAEEV
jgi:hypothetical protein